MRVAIPFAVAVSVVLTLGGCAFDPSSIPVPGTTVPGRTYPVHIQFANALNLPARAKVMANGIRVGNLTAVHVIDPSTTSGGYVVADVEIAESVQLPTTTTAQLRQATVLGDIYIGLATPQDGYGATISPDGTIPLQQSRPALQIEDTMAAMATFVQGGAVRQFQDIVNRMNSVLPADPAETARVFDSLGTDFTDLAAHLDQVSVIGHATEDLIALLQQRSAVVTDLLTDEGARHVVNAAASLVEAVGVLGEIGKLADALQWIAPLANAGDAAAKALVPLAFTSQPLDLNAPSNLNKLVALIRDKVIPFVDRGPKLNIIGVSKDEQVDRIVATLRMIGTVR